MAPYNENSEFRHCDTFRALELAAREFAEAEKEHAYEIKPNTRTG